MTDALGELIGRLEKCAGPDRELDCLIFAAVNEYPVDWQNNDLFVTVPSTGRVRLGMIDPGKKLRNFHGMWTMSALDILPVTSSIDAAMTPVPPKLFSWAMGDCNENDQPWACLTDSDGTDYAATGATPIIALCIAVLKAIASLKARA